MTIFYGGIAALIVLAVRWNWYVGDVLFVPFAILGVVSFLQSVFSFFSGCGATITYFFLKKHGTLEEQAVTIEGVTPDEQLFTFGSAVVQLIAGLFFIAFVIYIGGELGNWW